MIPLKRAYSACERCVTSRHADSTGWSSASSTRMGNAGTAVVTTTQGTAAAVATATATVGEEIGSQTRLAGAKRRPTKKTRAWFDRNAILGRRPTRPRSARNSQTPCQPTAGGPKHGGMFADLKTNSNLRAGLLAILVMSRPPTAMVSTS